MKAKLYLPIAAITFFALFPAHADYFDAVRGSVMNYKFGDFTLPANLEKRPIGKKRDRCRQRYRGVIQPALILPFQLTDPVGDNIYATSNPGIGIQYKTSVDTLTDAGGGTESTRIVASI